MTAWFGTVLALILVGLGLAVYLAMDHALLERIDASLTFEYEETAEKIQSGRLAARGLDALAEVFRETYLLRLDDPEGRLRLQSPALAGSKLPPVPPEDRPHFATVRLPRLGPHRLLAGRVVGPKGVWGLRIASSLKAHDRELAELKATLWTILPAGLVLAIAAGYALAGRSLAPVHRMTEAARKISARNLHDRLQVVNPDDELGRLAATLNAMLDRLDQTFAAMRRFTADAAHELRTPITTLRAEAEVALRSTRSAAMLIKVLESVVEEADRLGRLADRLLRLSREDAGLANDDLRPIRLDTILNHAVHRARAAAERAGLTIQLDQLPAAMVQADPDRLREVFDNLLDNAIKYNRPGGSVQVTGRADDGRALIAVSDTGIGIPTESQAHIFDRFYRADPSRSRRTGGFGLGLSIARAAVERLGGQIMLESNPSQGSTFRVVLPILREFSSEPVRRSLDVEEQADGPSVRGF